MAFCHLGPGRLASAGPIGWRIHPHLHGPSVFPPALEANMNEVVLTHTPTRAIADMGLQKCYRESVSDRLLEIVAEASHQRPTYFRDMLCPRSRHATETVYGLLEGKIQVSGVWTSRHMQNVIVCKHGKPLVHL